MSKEKMKTCTIFRSLSFFLLVRWSLCIALSTRTLNFSAKQSARQFYPEVVSNSVPKYLMTAGPSLLIHFCPAVSPALVFGFFFGPAVL